MDSFTNNEIQRRREILQTHKIFGNYLNKKIVNSLTILFDDKDTKLNIRKINKYLEDERKINNLNIRNTSITNYVYDEDKNAPTLHLGIKKNGNDFIHLTIHLSLNELKDDSAGMIHIKKDVYKRLESSQRLISKSKLNKFLYALIIVKVPENKPNSLEFSIEDQEFITPGIKNECLCDSEIKKEATAMIAVLNKLFDENNKEMFIGDHSRTPRTYNTRLPYPIHNKTNLILKGINIHTGHFTRKNKGSFINPLQSSEPFRLNSIATLDRRKTFRARRDGRKRSRLTRKSNKVNKKSTVFTNTEPLSQNNISEA